MFVCHIVQYRHQSGQLAVWLAVIGSLVHLIKEEKWTKTVTMWWLCSWDVHVGYMYMSVHYGMCLLVYNVHAVSYTHLTLPTIYSV